MLVVTDVRLYADGLATALVETPEIAVVVQAADCTQALRTLRARRADVVLLDLAGLGDLADARAFVEGARPAPVVALAVRETDADVVRWAEHGVAGIVTRTACFDDLLHALVSADRGECDCTPLVAAALLRRVAAVASERRTAAATAPLTAREQQIAELLVLGLTNKEIAASLLLGVSTVKNHVHHLLGKLGASTRSEAVARLTAAGVRAPERPGPGPHALETA